MNYYLIGESTPETDSAITEMLERLNAALLMGTLLESTITAVPKIITGLHGEYLMESGDDMFDLVVYTDDHKHLGSVPVVVESVVQDLNRMSRQMNGLDQ